MKILIMGLPGSGKTTLAAKLVSLIKAKWLNNDKVRKEANDWDFSEEARKRQAKRICELADKYKKDGHNVVADFVCPTPEARKLFNPDYIVWMNTIEKGRYDDTNKLFVKPKIQFDIHPNSFTPNPTVESTVLTLQREDINDVKERILAFNLAKIAFQQRRKIIKKSLSKEIDNLDKLSEIGISYNSRAEELSPEQYLLIANMVSNEN